MSDAAAFLARVVGALYQAGVPHMLAGSFASSMHGAPRATRDVDLSRPFGSYWDLARQK